MVGDEEEEEVGEEEEEEVGEGSSWSLLVCLMP